MQKKNLTEQQRHCESNRKKCLNISRKYYEENKKRLQ